MRREHPRGHLVHDQKKAEQRLAAADGDVEERAREVGVGCARRAHHVLFRVGSLGLVHGARVRRREVELRPRVVLTIVLNGAGRAVDRHDAGERWVAALLVVVLGIELDEDQRQLAAGMSAPRHSGPPQATLAPPLRHGCR